MEVRNKKHQHFFSFTSMQNHKVYVQATNYDIFAIYIFSCYFALIDNLVIVIIMAFNLDLVNG